MRYIYAAIMLASSVLAFFYATRIFYNNNHKKISYRLLTMISIASGLWSFGYGMMFAVSSMEWFPLYRMLGLFGVILYMIFGQIIIGVMSDRMKQMKFIMALEALVGVGVLISIILPSSYIMEFTDRGIITTFTSAFVSIFYSGYCVAVAIIYLIMLIYMLRVSDSKRIRSVGRAMLNMLTLITVGMIIDTILPALGINYNIPASSIFQFGGLEIFYRAIHSYNRNSISIENMTGYIYQSLKTPILVFDSNNQIKLANLEARKLFNFTEEDIEENKVTSFWENSFLCDPPQLAREKDATLTIDKLYRRKKMHCRLTIDPIYDTYQDYMGYIVVVTDMTEQVKNMELVENAKLEAELANQAKSQFLANMSHEIRTPMNAILGFSELALWHREEDMSDTVLEYFSDIYTSAESLLSIINSILDIAKVESGNMELLLDRYDTEELFREVLVVIGMQSSKKNLSFTMDVDKGFPSILMGDKEKIREVLINLLNNAIKYTEKGSIHMKVEMEEWCENYIKVRYIISDTGIGMKKNDLKHVFESFRRADMEKNKGTEGTGLGLAITKAFVDIMDGSITVDSVYGEGTTFTVEIAQEVIDATPIAINSGIEENTDMTQEVSKAMAKKKKDISGKMILKDVHILAVDDNEINQKIFYNIIKSYHATCTLASSGEDAIALCEGNTYDIVFVDQMMPGLDGIETMRLIRQLGNGYEANGTHKIVTLTANALKGVREEMIGYGFDEFLGKPIEFEKLEEILLRFLPPDKFEFIES